MTRQLSLDLTPGPDAGPAEFFVTPSNAAAHAAIMGDVPWPGGKLVLAGPAGAGKSHLARLWTVRQGGVLWSAATLPADLPTDLPLAGAAVAVEDMETLPPAAEEAMFHLHNHLAATGGLLLMTARLPPARWTVALPDLASRLQASAVAGLSDPDDRLLALVLAKLFADRQIVPTAGVIPYLVTRMERSFAAAARVVAALDRASLAEGRGVTRDLARAVLDNPPPAAR